MVQSGNHPSDSDFSAHAVAVRPGPSDAGLVRGPPPAMGMHALPPSPTVETSRRGPGAGQPIRWSAPFALTIR